MEWLFDLMDVPENIQRGLYVVRPIRGLSALIMAAVVIAILWLLWPWLWYFDLESTAVWTENALTTLQPTLGNVGIPLSETYRENIAWITTGTTMLPTLIEAFTVRFASGGIKAMRILVLFFASFDLLTDWPRVNAFIDGFNFSGGLLSTPLIFVVKILMLMLASFGLQTICAVLLVCAIALVFNARATPMGRARPGIAPSGAIDV